MENSKEEQIQERVWYAVQTFHCKEERLGEYFAKNNLSYFIPRRYEERMTLDGKKQRKLVPAIHNLLFLEKNFESNILHGLIKNSPIPFYLLYHRENKRLCEIRDREMVELRAVCDPDYEGTLYVDAAEADARTGSRVRVNQGLFKGLEGKLTRYKNRYYVVVTVASLGVMIHIPKWYCEKLD